MVETGRGWSALLAFLSGTLALTPTTPPGQGTTPYSVGFVEGPEGKTFAKGETQWMTLIPTIYNADTLGIRPDLVGRPITDEQMQPSIRPRLGQLFDPSQVSVISPVRTSGDDEQQVTTRRRGYAYPLLRFGQQRPHPRQVRNRLRHQASIEQSAE